VKGLHSGFFFKVINGLNTLTFL
jgi:hypothetical protein